MFFHRGRVIFLLFFFSVYAYTFIKRIRPPTYSYINDTARGLLINEYFSDCLKRARNSTTIGVFSLEISSDGKKKNAAKSPKMDRARRTFKKLDVYRRGGIRQISNQIIKASFR